MRGDNTKKITEERNTAQSRAAASGTQKDWREFRRLKTSVVLPRGWIARNGRRGSSAVLKTPQQKYRGL